LFNMVQRGSVSYNRINSLLEQESDITDPLNPIRPVVNGTLRYDIDFFRYDNEETLADIHFTLEKGQTLGLVGQTGSGKTSLIKLLLREHDV
ncbi:ATP-binding cassette domain-containing protein, partial [Acinetobacter baumannii]